MLDPCQFHHAWDNRVNRALAVLCPALDRALATGKSTVVTSFPTSLTQRELIALAVDLCRRSGSNAAVLAGQDARSFTFVPLTSRAPRLRRAAAAFEPYRPVALA
jgi:UDP:flavonoid glycosyltransferase YjiC (YdhE family)